MSLSCPCGHGCQPGCGCLYQVVLPDNPVAEYNFQNVGLIGIGTLDGVDGVDVNFRSVASANAALTVTLDAANNAIILTLAIGSIIDDLPQATTTQRGVGETATDAEALAKTSTTVFVTPSNFAAMGSSTTFAGLVELATDGETLAGVSPTLAVTPAGLAAVLGTLGHTVTWPDAATRAGATPDFVGQLGTQIDTDTVWVAAGPSAGDFSLPLLVFGTNVAPPVGSTTTITMTSAQSIQWLLNNASANVQFSGIGSLILDSVVDWLPSQQVQISSVAIPSQLLGTDGTSLINGYSISGFLSANNVQTGWGVPSGTLTRTTFVSYAGQTVSNPPTQAEMQALDNAARDNSRRLAALITDIMAINLPAA